MRRRLFNITAVVSLVLCVATAVLWVRSYWRSDALSYHGLEGQRFVQFARGLLLSGYDNVGSSHRKLAAHSWSARGMDLPAAPGWSGRLGFMYHRDVTPTATVPAE